MKSWNSTFNAQGSKLIIVVVHVNAMKIYVATMEPFKNKERQDETQFTPKIDGFLNFTLAPLFEMLMYFLKISPYVWWNSRF